MAISDGQIAQLLESLNADDPQAAERGWSAFLTAYSDLVYGVIQTIAVDEEQSGDCFLFVCQKLAERKYRRLRAFAPNGRAQFGTWLRAVTRNLSLDWYRSRFGRRRVFSFVTSRDSVDQEIFRIVFQRHASIYEAWRELAANASGISYEEVESRVETMREMLTSRQLWLLTLSSKLEESEVDEEGAILQEQADRSPSPETLALLQQIRQKVAGALRELSEADRLLLMLRFEEELELRQVAALVGLKDAQTADRRVKEALVRLRERLGIQQPLSGKRKSASV